MTDTMTTKRALTEVSSNQEAPPSKKTKKDTTSDELTGEALQKATSSVTRKLQGQINSRLKWKNSFRNLKHGALKGGRVEVVCNHPQVFEEIFGTAVKTSKDKTKLSCKFTTDDQVYELPLRGKSYRYNRTELCAPVSASLKDNTLVFSFKYTVV